MTPEYLAITERKILHPHFLKKSIIYGKKKKIKKNKRKTR